MNIGQSTKNLYDFDTYRDSLYESVSPLSYRVNPIQMYNCENCNSEGLGPRPSNRRGQNVSIDANARYETATSQELVDIESILSNRNVKNSRARTGEINQINPTEFKLQHNRICNDFLNPLSSKLTYPSANYRDMAINRFYNLNTNPQFPIFWDFSINTSNEMRDNFIEHLPKPIVPLGLPDEILCKNRIYRSYYIVFN